MKRSEVVKMLKENGYQLVRTGKHGIWKDEDGHSIALSTSPKLHHGMANMIRSKIRNKS